MVAPSAQNILAVAGERLLRPWVGVSVCVLIVNDHYLKQSYPGVLSGKLSDFAGLLLFPVFLQALWELAQRPRGGRLQHSVTVLCWCSWLTVATFTFVKITPWGGWLYSTGLGALQAVPAALNAVLRGETLQLSRVRLVQDPTDLCALPAALFDWWWSARATRRRSRHAPAVPRALPLAAALFGCSWVASAQAQPRAPAARAAWPDPTRHGRPGHPVGFYMRAAIGPAMHTGRIKYRGSIRTPNSHGSGSFDLQYDGHGASFDALLAMRVWRGVYGLAFITTDFDGSAEARHYPKLGGTNGDGQWWLFGPTANVQLGERLIWTLGGTLAWATWTPGGDGAEHAGWGGSIWFGPSWPLGRGWLLGGHLRLTGLGTPWGVLPVDAPARFAEAALLVGFSFQSP